MSWNYRVMAHEHEIDSLTEIDLIIHEVYYDEKGNPKSYGEDPVIIAGENLLELEDALLAIKDCLKKSILWYGDKFPKEYYKQ